MAKYYDFASVQAGLAAYASYAPKFSLDPKKLQGLNLPVTLKWKRRPFVKSNASAISDDPGIYAFSIRHPRLGLPPHGYVLYIGQAGAGRRRTRTLRKRFNEYFGDRIRPKRLHVHYFLNAWATCLVFNFASVDPTSVSLLKVEAALNDALMPPFSVNDFSADVRPMKRLSEKF